LEPAAFCVQCDREESMSESEKNEIGKCSMCQAAIYAGEPRKGIWRFVLPPRIVRTCVCFDVILGNIQYSLVTGAPMVGALALMPVCEDER
jgi:hypothetical protein